MNKNSNLHKAKENKNDEFYTQYSDIENEMNAYIEFNPDVFKGKTVLLPCDDPEWSNFTKYFANNFEQLGLKKLISTSYAKGAGNKQLTLFEEQSPLYDAQKHDTHGKLFVLTHDTDGSGNIDVDDIEFSGYLEGDGDFRSEEVCKLRDEADIIITNPPFSLFREFLAWIMEANKQFVIIGNVNAITYKDVFPLLKDNKIWLGYMSPKIFIYKDGTKRQFGNILWYTNLDIPKRHEDLILYKKYNPQDYPKYDNYNAININKTKDIPIDYDGIMGVPITFLSKYNPEQFELIGVINHGSDGNWDLCKCMINGKEKFKRLAIRKRKSVVSDSKIGLDGRQRTPTDIC